MLYLKRKNVHKYACVVFGRDGVEVMSIIDFVLVKRDMLEYVHDMKAVRELDKASQTILLPYEDKILNLIKPYLLYINFQPQSFTRHFKFIYNVSEMFSRFCHQYCIIHIQYLFDFLPSSTATPQSIETFKEDIEKPLEYYASLSQPSPYLTSIPHFTHALFSLYRLFILLTK